MTRHGQKKRRRASYVFRLPAGKLIVWHFKLAFKPKALTERYRQCRAKRNATPLYLGERTRSRTLPRGEYMQRMTLYSIPFPLNWCFHILGMELTHGWLAIDWSSPLHLGQERRDSQRLPFHTSTEPFSRSSLLLQTIHSRADSNNSNTNICSLDSIFPSIE